MQKAYLYEAIFLVNHGIDDAVRGLERLKRAKNSGQNPEYFDEKLTMLEAQRALLNARFCSFVETLERRDEVRFGRLLGHYEKKFLDEVQVYRDVQAVEERRLSEGKPPRIRFLGNDELRAWDGLKPNLPRTATSSGSCETEGNARG